MRKSELRLGVFVIDLIRGIEKADMDDADALRGALVERGTGQIF
jgi:hypothetical protein